VPRTLALVAIAACVTAAAGCGGDTAASGDTSASTRASARGSLPRAREPVELRPADFVRRIDNQWWPMLRGSRWVYREVDRDGTTVRVEVTVTNRTRTILGIPATVVHDVVTEDGELKEDTYDWFAQDRAGNVWYLGEDTKEYENGKVVSTKGSWEAGVDGAHAGVIMPARPRAGLTFREEYYEGEAEDRAEILGFQARVRVPAGAFQRVLKTKETTPLEPNVVEHKFYARGIGPVLVVGVSRGNSREELVSFRRGR
jgi:hypothetical protein